MKFAKKKEKHRKTGTFIQDITIWYQHAFIILTITARMSNLTMITFGSIIFPQHVASQKQTEFQTQIW